jgi:peroxiredoxin
MKAGKLLASIAAFALITSGTSALAQNATAPANAPVKTEAPKAEQPKKEDVKTIEKKAEKAAEKQVATAVVGSAAPDFTLTDTDGKQVKLSSFAGKVVVLEWFNPDCPFVKKHHDKNKTFAELYTKYSAKDVVFLAINSGAAGKEGAGKERNVKAKADYKIAYSILLDETGTVGKEYGAKNTPAMYIIDAKGILAYSGAIDDNESATTPGQTNYVAKALDEILAGKPVTTKSTKAYGCSVKYAAK